MFASFKKLIFGVPPTITKAMVKPSRTPTKIITPESPTYISEATYLPESLVPEKGIEGVADDRSCWQEWRIDPISGEQWYKRISDVVSVNALPDIEAFDSCDDHSDAEVETQDELDEQNRLTELMFRKHKLRARINPFNVPQEEPSDDE